MTEVLAPFIISINEKIYWHHQAFRLATCHHMYSQKYGKIAKQLYFANFTLVEADMRFKIENQYTGSMIINLCDFFPTGHDIYNLGLSVYNHNRILKLYKIEYHQDYRKF